MFEDIKFDDKGLIPVITQDIETNEILMFAFMNQESLSLSIKHKEMYYYSRSRQELWHKGATSNNIQSIISLTLDCDKDVILAKVKMNGTKVACHTGKYSCFFNQIKLED